MSMTSADMYSAMLLQARRKVQDVMVELEKARQEESKWQIAMRQAQAEEARVEQLLRGAIQQAAHGSRPALVSGALVYVHPQPSTKYVTQESDFEFV